MAVVVRYPSMKRVFRSAAASTHTRLLPTTLQGDRVYARGTTVDQATASRVRPYHRTRPRLGRIFALNSRRLDDKEGYATDPSEEVRIAYVQSASEGLVHGGGGGGEPRRATAIEQRVPCGRVR